MRVLVLAPPWFPVPPTGYGGVEWIVSLLAEGLVERGHDVTLLASGDSRTRARHRSVFDVAPSERIGNAFVEAAHVVAGYLDADDYDVVIDHSGVIGASIGAMIRQPVVHTLHGPWTPDSRRLYRRIGRRLHLVAISHDQASRSPADVPIAGVVHNAIPIERYPYREAKEDFLAFVGRASPEKGPEVAVEVARRLGRKLVMCCKVNEPDEHAYWNEVVVPRLRGVDVDVVQGLTNGEKAEVMGRASVVLFPIRWPEPFGLVMAEANACGTPVVAFGDGAVPEVLVDGVTGRVVPPGDVDAFVEAVDTARDLRPEACRMHVEASFTAERLVASYEAVMRRVAQPEYPPFQRKALA